MVAPAGTSTPEPRPIKLLVIDDDPDTCDLNREAFEPQGHLVAVAHDAAGGLERSAA